MFNFFLIVSLQYIDFQYRTRLYFESVKGWEKMGKRDEYLIYDTIVFLLALGLN